MSTDLNNFIDQIVRRERGRLIADLVAHLGRNHIELAEDMVQEAIIAALNQWSFSGLPEKPAAWLNRVARNKAYDQLRKYTKETLVDEFDNELEGSETSNTILTGSKIKDAELKLFFMCCKQDLGRKEQLALILNLACGFTAKDIAELFLSTDTATAQLLSRTKRKLRTDKATAIKEPTLFDIKAGIPIIHKAIYLLFTIGYSSVKSTNPIQEHLAFEALRLIKLLLSNAQTTTPEGHAIAALICFQSARFKARFNSDNKIILLKDQDQKLWDQKLIQEGFTYLQASKNTDQVSRYHIEAAIASVHILPQPEGTPDLSLLRTLYNQLSNLVVSPIVTLNHAVVEIMSGNYTEAATLLDAIDSNHQMKFYAPYYLVRGELYTKTQRPEKARKMYDIALAQKVNLPLKQLLEDKIDEIISG